MRVFLVDGTYELFRHHFGQPPHRASDGTEAGAARGVVLTVLRMLESGDRHIGVATDHVIESFRNELWPGYKTGEGIPSELRTQFDLLEDALTALGVTVWPMVELEADDALASAASIAAADSRVEQVVICTPDKDLAQCVVGDRIVQLDRRHNVTCDEQGVWEKFGVAPRSIPDWLALVGDSADGFPGLPGWGKQSASTALAHYGTIEAIPDSIEEWDATVRKKLRGGDKLAATLAAQRENAELFRTLATLRIDPELFDDVESTHWTGPTERLEQIGEFLRDSSLVRRAETLRASLRSA